MSSSTISHGKPAGSDALAASKWSDSGDQQEVGRISAAGNSPEEIAGRQSAEAALRESEARYRLLFETMIQGVLFLDADGFIISANPAAEKILGRSFGQLQGLKPADLGWTGVDDSGREQTGQVHPAILALQEGVEVRNMVMAVSRPGQESRRWIRVSAIPLTQRSSDPTFRVYITIDDVTERQLVARALRESEAKYRTLVEQLPAIIYTAEGIGSRRLLYVSPQVESVLGYPADAWLGDSAGWESALHPADRRRVLAMLSALEAGESEVLSLEYRMLDSDGAARWFRDEAQVVLDPAGRPLFLQGVMMDITASKEVEAASERRSAELADLNKVLLSRNEELDAYSHTVAHDLKNPLAILLGFAELLQQDYGESEDEALGQGVAYILENALRMESIIDELLLLAEVRRRDEINLTPLDMAEIVAETRRRMRALVERHEGEITIPETWPTALGHAPWIQEIWVNYISNAIKYGGLPPQVELGAMIQGDGMVRFWVRDNGLGISTDDQKRLFAPFAKLYRIRAQGHGLGLSIVQRIAGKLGGQAGVDSQIGQGSVFWFTLPLAEGPA